MGSGRAGASLPGSKGALEMAVPALWLCPQSHQLTWSQEFESKLFWMMSGDGVEVKYCARKGNSGKLRWLGSLAGTGCCPKGSEDE